MEDNWSLIFADTYAQKYEKSLIIGYNLDPSFLGGGRRQLDWKIASLREVQKKCNEHGYTFCLFLGSTIQPLLDFVNTLDCVACVTDFFPLHLPKKWNEEFLRETKSAFFVVDSHNIVPCHQASNKQEF